MTGKVIYSSSFADTLDYVLFGDGEKLKLDDQNNKIQRGKIIGGTMAGESAAELKAEERALRDYVNPAALSRAAHHILSPAEKDLKGLPPDRKDRFLNVLARDYLKQFGYTSNAICVIVKHEDTDHDHIHIVAARLETDGRKVSDSFSRKRHFQICRALEIKYDLQVLPDAPQSSIKPLTLNEMGYTNRTGVPTIKEQLRQTIEACAAEDGATMSDLGKRLEAGGVSLQIKTTAAHRVVGISFAKLQTNLKFVAVKGGDLGMGYTWHELIKKFDYEPVRDLPVLLEMSAAASGVREAVAWVDDIEKRAPSVARLYRSEETPQDFLALLVEKQTLRRQEFRERLSELTAQLAERYPLPNEESPAGKSGSPSAGLASAPGIASGDAKQTALDNEREAAELTATIERLSVRLNELNEEWKIVSDQFLTEEFEELQTLTPGSLKTRESTAPIARKPAEKVVSIQSGQAVMPPRNQPSNVQPAGSGADDEKAAKFAQWQERQIRSAAPAARRVTLRYAQVGAIHRVQEEILNAFENAAPAVRQTFLTARRQSGETVASPDSSTNDAAPNTALTMTPPAENAAPDKAPAAPLQTLRRAAALLSLTDESAARDDLAQKAARAAAKSHTIPEFIENLEASGINLKANLQRSGKVTGCRIGTAVDDENFVSAKGSEINLSWQTLIKKGQLEFVPERDLPKLESAAVRYERAESKCRRSARIKNDNSADAANAAKPSEIDAAEISPAKLFKLVQESTVVKALPETNSPAETIAALSTTAEKIGWLTAQFETAGQVRAGQPSPLLAATTKKFIEKSLAADAGKPVSERRKGELAAVARSFGVAAPAPADALDAALWLAANGTAAERRLRLENQLDIFVETERAAQLKGNEIITQVQLREVESALQKFDEIRHIKRYEITSSAINNQANNKSTDNRIKKTISLAELDLTAKAAARATVGEAEGDGSLNMQAFQKQIPRSEIAKIIYDQSIAAALNAQHSERAQILKLQKDEEAALRAKVEARRTKWEKVDELLSAQRTAFELDDETMPAGQLPPETIWRVQRRAALCNDLESFVELEQYHRALDQPRSRQAAARLVGTAQVVARRDRLAAATAANDGQPSNALIKSRAIEERSDNSQIQSDSPSADQTIKLVFAQKNGKIAMRRMCIENAPAKNAASKTQTIVVAVSAEKKAAGRENSFNSVQNVGISAPPPNTPVLKWLSQLSPTTEPPLKTGKTIKANNEIKIVQALSIMILRKPEKLGGYFAVAPSRADNHEMASGAAAGLPGESRKTMNSKLLNAVNDAIAGEAERRKSIAQQPARVAGESAKMPPAEISLNELNATARAGIELRDAELLKTYRSLIQQPEFHIESSEVGGRAAARQILADMRTATDAARLFETAEINADNELEVTAPLKDWQNAVASLEVTEVAAEFRNERDPAHEAIPKFAAAELVWLDELNGRLDTSVRSNVEELLAASLQPTVIDQFSDQTTRKIAPEEMTDLDKTLAMQEANLSQNWANYAARMEEQRRLYAECASAEQIEAARLIPTTNYTSRNPFDEQRDAERLLYEKLAAENANQSLEEYREAQRTGSNDIEPDDEESESEDDLLELEDEERAIRLFF